MEEIISIVGGHRHGCLTIGLTPALDRPDGLRDLGKWLHDHFYLESFWPFFCEELK